MFSVQRIRIRQQRIHLGRDALLRDMQITKKSMDNYERMKYRS
jgi:hypothetical protein